MSGFQWGPVDKPSTSVRYRRQKHYRTVHRAAATMIYSNAPHRPLTLIDYSLDSAQDMNKTNKEAILEAVSS